VTDGAFDVRATGSPESVADLVELSLRRSGWRVQRETPCGGTARAGNRAAHLVAGGLAPSHALDWRVEPGPDATVRVALIRRSDGRFGGLLGRHRVRRRFDDAADAVRAMLDERGLLAA